MNYFVYIIECKNGAYYTGYTTDVKRRYQAHCDGSAKCKYTRSFSPRRLAAYWSVGTQLSNALKVERAIKRLPKKTKHLLTVQPSQLASVIPVTNNN